MVESFVELHSSTVESLSLQRIAIAISDVVLEDKVLVLRSLEDKNQSTGLGLEQKVVFTSLETVRYNIEK